MAKKVARVRTRDALNMLTASFDFSGQATRQMVIRTYRKNLGPQKGDWAAVVGDLSKASGVQRHARAHRRITK